MKISDNVKNTIIVLSAVAALCLIVRFAGPVVLMAAIYLFRILSPFIFGFAFSRLINPIADKLGKKLKIPRVVSVVVVIVITLAALVGIIGGIGYKLSDEIRNLYHHWPEIADSVKTAWENFASKLSRVYIDMPDSVQSALDGMSASLREQFSRFMSDMELVSSAQNAAKSLPGGIIWAIVFVLSLFFMVTQKQTVDDAIKRALGERAVNKLREIRNECRVYLGGYFKAQGILMIIVFFLIEAVLALLGAPYSLLIAALTAILDALPFFGSGITLWPLAVVYLVSGNFKLGIGYIAVYLAVALLRRLIEPKLVSDRMGLNPILTLISMYVGYRWWGIIGMLIGPILLMLIVSLYKVGLFDGIIKIIKRLAGFAAKEFRLITGYLDRITK